MRIFFIMLSLILSIAFNLFLIMKVFEFDGMSSAYKDAFNASRNTLEGYLRTKGNRINNQFVCKEIK